MNVLSAMALISLLLLLLLGGLVNAYPGCRDSGNCGQHLKENGSLGASLPSLARTVNGIPQAENPNKRKSRQKRLSDQRRAELETLVALSKMTARLTAVSRSGRHLDPAKIGR